VRPVPIRRRTFFQQPPRHPSSPHHPHHHHHHRHPPTPNQIVLAGVDDDPAVARAAAAALPLRANYAYTLSEVQDAVRRVFDTGFFTAATPKAEDTRDGVRLTVSLSPYPRLKRVVVTGADALPARIIEDALAPSAGRTLNFHGLRAALDAANAWYDERGIPTRLAVLADREDGVLELGAAEAVVNAVHLRFVDRETGEVKPGGGYTRPAVILRQLATRPGRVYSARQAKADLDAVFAMGLFEDVNLVPQAAAGSGGGEDGGGQQPPSPSSSSPFDAVPGGPAPAVDVTLTLVERKTGGASAGGGISATGAADGALPGFIGSASFSQRNVFGTGQKLAATAELGQVDKLFRLHHTDPWLLGDPHRTSRTVSLQNTRATGGPTHGRAPDDALPGGGGGASSSTGDAASVVIARLTGGVEFSRPLAVGWTGTLGASWQRGRCTDEHGRGLATDAYGGPLTFSAARAAGAATPSNADAALTAGPPPSPSAPDTVATALVGVSYAGPAGEALATFEQALPLAPSWLNFNRLRVRTERRASLASIGLPRWTASASARAGAVFGDLPPYEAFPLGGTNSVRGYGEGALGTGRSFAEATAELVFPLPGASGGVEGALFADYGSDLGSGPSVPGDPAGARGKPGAGAGVGVGVRVDSPVGPLRLECALSDRGARRFHLGIGSHS
jgi:outer membrane protein insertion porin family